MENEINLRICQTMSEFEMAKSITRDYMNWLGMDLSYQDIDNEFESFHLRYMAPDGGYVLAIFNDTVAGGGGFRKLSEGVCEMKRLFVYDTFQGKGIGGLLCQKIIEMARSLNFEKMWLDTLPRLKNANRLYEKVGFYDIPKYYNNPNPGVRYMELIL